MARGRMILKQISNSETMASLPVPCILLYTWLIPHLDVNGNFYGNPALVKSLVLPLLKSITEGQTDRYLRLLSAKKLIIFYKNDGKTFLNVPDFAEKQIRLDGEKSVFPLYVKKTEEKTDGNRRKPSGDRREVVSNIIEYNLIKEKGKKSDDKATKKAPSLLSFFVYLKTEFKEAVHKDLIINDFEAKDLKSIYEQSTDKKEPYRVFHAFLYEYSEQENVHPTLKRFIKDYSLYLQKTT